jgi:hypothetical protein
MPLLGVYPKGCKPTNESSCIPIFIIALSTIATLWDQPQCLTTDEWIQKMWPMYTSEYYSATNKSEITTFAGKWIEVWRS